MTSTMAERLVFPATPATQADYVAGRPRKRCAREIPVSCLARAHA
jgi:hypothetical protein